MALSFEPSTQQQISFDEFLEKVSGAIRPDDASSLIDCVEPLQMLSNNETFLCDYLNNGLKEYLTFQEDNRYNSDIFLLHRQPDFFIRCVVWNGLRSDTDQLKKQEDIYHTLRAHDHNFSFLTVGYLNEGYITDIWEYDNKDVIGYVGEPVDLRYLERTSLPKGKAMLYRASTDIHAQHPPQKQSVSINIMFNDQNTLNKEQYYFDVQKGVIDSHVSVSSSGRHLMMEMAKLFGNSQSLSIIENISEKHQSAHVRAKAYETIAHITGDRDIWKNGLKDPDRIVNIYSKRALYGA